MLLSDDAHAAVDPRARPNGWKQHGVTMRLSYHFEPGSDRDGVSVHVPLSALGGMDQAGFESLVPGMRHELVTTLIRMLPKDLRHPLVPVPDVATALLERLSPRTEPLLDALRREIETLRGVRILADTWSLDALPAHLRMTFRIEDAEETWTEGYDLAALREELRPRLQAQLAQAAPELARTRDRHLGPGDAPARGRPAGTGGAVRAYPALVDEGATAGVRMVDAPQAQAVAMAAGTRRLLQLTVPSPVKPVVDRLGTAATLTLAGAPHGNLGAVVEDATTAALDRLIATGGGPAWDEAEFARLRDHVAGELVAATHELLDQTVCGSSTPRERWSGRSTTSRPTTCCRPRGWTWRGSSGGSCTPGSSRRPAPRDCPTWSGTCRERPSAWIAWRPPPVRTATACTPSTTSRRPTGPAWRHSATARARLPCGKSRGCWRNCASATSPRVWAPRGPSPAGGSARPSTNPENPLRTRRSVCPGALR